MYTHHKVWRYFLTPCPSTVWSSLLAAVGASTVAAVPPSSEVAEAGVVVGTRAAVWAYQCLQAVVTFALDFVEGMADFRTEALPEQLGVQVEAEVDIRDLSHSSIHLYSLAGLARDPGDLGEGFHFDLRMTFVCCQLSLEASSRSDPGSHSC